LPGKEIDHKKAQKTQRVKYTFCVLLCAFLWLTGGARDRNRASGGRVLMERYPESRQSCLCASLSVRAPREFVGVPLPGAIQARMKQPPQQARHQQPQTAPRSPTLV